MDVSIDGVQEFVQGDVTIMTDGTLRNFSL